MEEVAELTLALTLPWGAALVPPAFTRSLWLAPPRLQLLWCLRPRGRCAEWRTALLKACKSLTQS